MPQAELSQSIKVLLIMLTGFGVMLGIVRLASVPLILARILILLLFLGILWSASRQWWGLLSAGERAVMFLVLFPVGMFALMRLILGKDLFRQILRKTPISVLSRKRGVRYLKELERQIFRLTNKARRRNRRPPLSWDNDLARMAWQKSADMSQKEYLSHTSPEGYTFKNRIRGEQLPSSFYAGENISLCSLDNSMDIKTLARLFVDGWMNSPGHRQNILDPRFTHLGVGVAATDKECYATQIFRGTC